MASASDHRAHAALQPADCLILLPQRLPAAVETSIGPAHYPAECTQSDAFLQPSLRARNGRANSNSFSPAVGTRTWAENIVPAGQVSRGTVTEPAQPDLVGRKPACQRLRRRNFEVRGMERDGLLPGGLRFDQSGNGSGK